MGFYWDSSGILVDFNGILLGFARFSRSVTVVFTRVVPIKHYRVIYIYIYMINDC